MALEKQCQNHNQTKSADDSRLPASSGSPCSQARVPTVFARATYVVPVSGVGLLITWLADADGIALKVWLALGRRHSFKCLAGVRPRRNSNRLAGIRSWTALISGHRSRRIGARYRLVLWQLLPARQRIAGRCYTVLPDSWTAPSTPLLKSASGTRGCAICIGCGFTSVMLRSTSPRCGPWNGLRAV